MLKKTWRKYTILIIKTINVTTSALTDGKTPLMGGGNMILLSYNKDATQIDDFNKDSQAGAAVDGNTDGYWGSK